MGEINNSNNNKRATFAKDNKTCYCMVNKPALNNRQEDIYKKKMTMEFVEIWRFDCDEYFIFSPVAIIQQLSCFLCVASIELWHYSLLPLKVYHCLVSIVGPIEPCSMAKGHQT